MNSMNLMNLMIQTHTINIAGTVADPDLGYGAFLIWMHYNQDPDPGYTFGIRYTVGRYPSVHD
jgi:hypothetical protein